MYCGENHLLDLTVAQTERVLAVVVKIQSDIRLRSRTVVRKMNVDALLPGVPITQTGECPGSLTTRGSVQSRQSPPAAVAAPWLPHGRLDLRLFAAAKRDRHNEQCIK